MHEAIESRQVNLRYGEESVPLRIPSNKLVGVFQPRDLPTLPDPAAALKQVLLQPHGRAPLREVAASAQRVAIAIEDATRPVPNRLILDSVIGELQEAGITPEQITVIVATGLHRPMTPDEVHHALGRWAETIRVENHDANDATRLVRLGKTRLGTDISVNRSFIEADVRITTGDVEYHQFCGYGGGAKCVYPGMANADAIRANHSRMDLPGTGPGILADNPVRDEIDEVGKMANIHFNVSVVLNANHVMVGVHAGDPRASLLEARCVVDEMYRVEVPRRADLVVASPGGHPKDIDLYQTQKAISQAVRIVRPGGRVLLLARCREGSGSREFEAWMDEAYEPADIIRRIHEHFQMGGHKAYQIAREVERAEIHLYSEISPGRTRAWMMQPVRSLEEIDHFIAAAGSVVVLPQATLVLARVSDASDP